jgi:Arc/MetJ-type ribon-helix-helix transcriptional regulator
LIYLTTLYNKDVLDEDNEAARREKINRAWKEVYYQLGRNENEPLSDDEFLRAHWIMYFSYSRHKGDDYIRFLLRKFSHKSIFEDVLTATQEEELPVDIDDPEIEEEGETEPPEPIITAS